MKTCCWYSLHTVFDLITALCTYVFQNYWEHSVVVKYTIKGTFKNKSCRRTASSPAGYILYCNIFIIKPYNIGHTDLDVFVCKSFCHIDIIIQV